jgi:hypothetical protein
MILELDYVTETPHIHWSSVKLAYLIGWRLCAHAPMHMSPTSRLVTGLSDRPQSELNLTGRVLPMIECVNRSVQESSATLRYLSKTSRADGTAPEWHSTALSVPSHMLVQAEQFGYAESCYANLEVFSGDLCYITCFQAHTLHVLPVVTTIYTTCVVRPRLRSLPVRNRLI